MSWPEDSSEANQAHSSSTGTEDELFVFGYSCKVFRDDEKAEWVEEGRHLIPWMGDIENGLLVDRYDVRGALMDLRPYEAPAGGSNVLERLSDEELMLEKLCDEERYRDFDEDTEYDENAYQNLEVHDENLSVKTETTTSAKEFSSVGYVYNDNATAIGPEPKKLQDELPYVQPQDLVLPPDIQLPATMKSHAIIEKTAKFIASQGTQMEIILKTKQSKNPLFDFLSHGDPLNPYYKFLVDAIKTNVYKPPDEIPYPDDSPSNGKGESDENSSDDENYLHPSLINKTSASDINKFLIPSMKFKPSLNCVYSLLVSKIQDICAESNPPKENHAQPESDAPKNISPSNQISGISNYNYSQEYTTPPVVNSMPSAQDQLIIDKMANYVVKNGPDFETMARTKGDPRFAFLDPYHEHYWYYMSCKERCLIEAKAVVASKGFVRYKEEKSLQQVTTSQQLPVVAIPEKSTTSSQSNSSVFQNSSTNKVAVSNPGEEIRKTTVTANRMRAMKESISSLAKSRAEKEKIIKLPLSLPNFTTVLKQTSTEDDLESDGKDKVSKNVPLKDESTKDEDDVRKLKEERRKKAALFLQRIKKLESMQAQNNTTTEVPNDCRPDPSPPTVVSVAISKEQRREPSQTKDTNLASSTSARDDDESCSTKDSPDILLEKIKSRDSTSREKDRVHSKYRSADRHSRNHRRSRSRHRRSRSSSFSDSNQSSSSYSPKRKKSKRKHSKKRHKKRDRSRSKKSKKHRR